MTQLKVLIVGGGVAGPTLAFWLARAGHEVTVVERFPELRVTGAQIDIRAQGIRVVKRMGLLDTVRSKVVDEDGLQFVTSSGRATATFLANKTGKGRQSVTSEFEIMRGDLVRLLYDATRDTVKYVFGKTVDHFKQDADGVTVSFSDGVDERYDVLVGADGQGSRIRKAILPPGAPDPLLHTRLYMAYWFIPRTEHEGKVFSVYIPGNGRVVMNRSHSPDTSQALVACKADKDDEEIKAMPRAPVDEQKKFWARKFAGAGWHTDRFIRGMDTTDNFYCQEVVQVRTDTWSKGRVVLLADAAHCPSPFTGMGTTSAFVGAYVLAGELNRNSDNLDVAFANYDKTLRPFITDIQDTLKPGFVRFAYPDSWFGVMVFHTIVGVLSFLRIPSLISRFSSEDMAGWTLPEYPELKPEMEKA